MTPAIGILSDLGRAGLYHLPAHRRAAVEAAARELHLRLATAPLGCADSKTRVLHRLAGALHFPPWFDPNLDALFDCLTDPERYPAAPRVLLIDGFDHLRLAAPEDFAALIETLRDAGDSLRASGLPCWILIDTPARGVPGFPDA